MLPTKHTKNTKGKHFVSFTDYEASNLRLSA